MEVRLIHGEFKTLIYKFSSGTLSAGMSASGWYTLVRNISYFFLKIGCKVVHFTPESLVHFAPE